MDFEEYIVDENSFVIKYVRTNYDTEKTEEIDINNLKLLDGKPYEYSHKIILTNKNFKIIFEEEEGYFRVNISGKMLSTTCNLDYLCQKNDEFYFFESSGENELHNYIGFSFCIPVKSKLIMNLKKLYNFIQNYFNSKDGEQNYYQIDEVEDYFSKKFNR